MKCDIIVGIYVRILCFVNTAKKCIDVVDSKEFQVLPVSHVHLQSDVFQSQPWPSVDMLE